MSTQLASQQVQFLASGGSGAGLGAKYVAEEPSAPPYAGPGQLQPQYVKQDQVHYTQLPQYVLRQPSAEPIQNMVPDGLISPEPGISIGIFIFSGFIIN